MTYGIHSNRRRRIRNRHANFAIAPALECLENRELLSAIGIQNPACTPPPSLQNPQALVSAASLIATGATQASVAQDSFGSAFSPAIAGTQQSSATVTGLTADVDPDTGNATITWQPAESAIGYRIRINNLSTGEAKIVLENLTDPEWTSPEVLPIGRYKVWVKPLFPQSMSGVWSEPLIVRIRTRPVWISESGRTLDATPTVRWSPVDGAVSYEIWSDNRTDDLPMTISEQGLTATSFTPPTELPIGHHAWWVRAMDAAGLPTRWSRITSTFVATEAVALQSALETADRKPVFEWAPVNGADRYRLWVNNRSTSEQQIIDLNDITSTSFTPGDPLPIGEFDWWVRAINDGPQSAFAANWSQVATIHVGAPPVIFTPQTITGDDKVIVGWTSIDRAAGYDVWVDDNTVGIPQVFRQTVVGHEVNLTNVLARSRDYRVWVRAIASDGSFGAWSDAHTLHVV